MTVRVVCVRVPAWYILVDVAGGIVGYKLVRNAVESFSRAKSHGVFYLCKGGREFPEISAQNILPNLFSC